jgi:sodium-dependent phosphate transporter
MAPAIAAGFGAVIFSLIRLVVHMRRNPVPWAVYTSPFWFLVAGTICTLSVVYKGSPKLGLNKKPSWYVASVTMGCGIGLAILAALFFVPYAHAKIIKKDPGVKGWMFIMGPLLFMRPAPSNTDDRAVVPNYHVVQDDHAHQDQQSLSTSPSNPEHDMTDKEAALNAPAAAEAQLSYRSRLAESQESHHAHLRAMNNPMGWAMRFLHNNPMGQGEIYEIKNMKLLLARLPAQIVVGSCYGFFYDIHAAQSGVHGTPEGDRMARVYSEAKKYPNEVEHCYSFVQVLTACTASFAYVSFQVFYKSIIYLLTCLPFLQAWRERHRQLGRTLGCDLLGLDDG